MKKFDIKWIATALFMFGGTSVAVQVPWMKFAFPAFVLAHSVLLYDFYTSHRNKPLMIQNSYFFIVNIIATIVWFTK